jgi:hypothetical protein
MRQIYSRFAQFQIQFQNFFWLKPLPVAASRRKQKIFLLAGPLQLNKTLVSKGFHQIGKDFDSVKNRWKS